MKKLFILLLSSAICLAMDVPNPSNPPDLKDLSQFPPLVRENGTQRPGELTAVCYDSENRLVELRGLDPEHETWQLWREGKRLTQTFKTRHGLRSLKSLEDGTLVVAGSGENVCFDPATGKERARVDATAFFSHNNSLYGLTVKVLDEGIIIDRYNRQGKQECEDEINYRGAGPRSAMGPYSWQGKVPVVLEIPEGTTRGGDLRKARSCLHMVDLETCSSEAVSIDEESSPTFLIQQAAMSPTGLLFAHTEKESYSRFAGWVDKNSIEIWDLRDARDRHCVGTISLKERNQCTAWFLPRITGSNLWALALPGMVQLWDMRRMDDYHAAKPVAEKAINNIKQGSLGNALLMQARLEQADLSPDGKKFSCVGRDGACHTINFNT